MVAAVAFAILAAAAGACACETVLTSAELSADLSRAVVFSGGLTGGKLGSSVNGAGDVNGDGFADFTLAAPYEGAQNTGAVYLIFGRNSSAWASASFNFSTADTPEPASWVKIIGAPNSFIGFNGVAFGDFNGDSYSDLLISSDNENKAFCAFGHAGPWSSFAVTDIEGGAIDGVVIVGGERAQKSVGRAGDLNGDGIDDMLIIETNAGKAFVVFGFTGEPRILNLSYINGTNGFALTDGSTTLGNGRTRAGDINGDGLEDLALGSYTGNSIGRAYVVFARNVAVSGAWASYLNLATELTGTNGFIVEGPTLAQLGWTAVGAGDVNSDGFDDVFIGSKSATGGAWIVFGHAAPWTQILNATQLNGTNGFHFADPFGDQLGHCGGSAGDINGDGFDDIIISGFDAKNSLDLPSGVAVILFGHGGTWPATLDRNDTKGSVGFMIDGPAASSGFGRSARAAGDVNGDGLADVVVGAPYWSGVGYAALVFGVADDHCAVCSNITDACIVCDDGFFLNGTLCEKTEAHFSSSALATAVVVIETGGGGGGGNVSELATEIAQLLGVDVGQISVVEITPGTFEVTVINEEVAQQLVTLITQCIEQEASEQ